MLKIFACAGLLFAPAYLWSADIRVAKEAVKLIITPISERTVRVTLVPQNDAAAERRIEESQILDLRRPHAPLFEATSLDAPRTVHAGKLSIELFPNPLRITVREGKSTVQTVRIAESSGEVSFDLGSKPLLGLGEGGPQFDRRGNNYPMISSQEAFHKPAFGGRMPVPWLIGDRWALFFHAPEGAFDLSGPQGKLTHASWDSVLPLDFFVTVFEEPAQALSEYARITGFPSLPPEWALGYEQSHRTIEDRKFVFDVANRFRDDQLPCDVLIYLGTGWAPIGWNTGHRSFQFNPKVFPDPAADIRALKDLHYKIVLHEMGPPKKLYGRAGDRPDNDDPNNAANYWKLHAPLEKLGIDGWWPDEGENLSRESRLTRVRMYWEGPQIERPGVRPYTLNRAGYAGMQRWGGWLWSGDDNATWETLTNQVPVGINTGLSGIPFWGTDIGGFFSTKELTGELYVRWFQFGAFCPIFRSHGRPSQTRFPWGWNTGGLGEPEASPEVKGSALPDLSELHNAQVEPICKRYLDLRYRMLPYIYSAARESHETGLPLMRALWIYYSDDARASARGDEYLWGRDMLVAPVTQKGAASRSLYLPSGAWYDFWTNKPVQGGREIERKVDLATLPLYVRAGAIVPFAPVKQYYNQPASAPTTIRIYGGANGDFVLYEDDGDTFAFERGEFTKIAMHWNDRAHKLTMSLAPGSKPPMKQYEVKFNRTKKAISLGGTQTSVQF